MALAKNWDGGDGLTEDREKLLEVEAGEEVESERLRLKVIARKVVGGIEDCGGLVCSLYE